jgi:hypothetical protein
MLEQPDILQIRQLRADGRRAPGHVVLLGDPLRADRLVQLAVCFHQLAKEESLSGRDLHAPIVAKD